MGEDNPAYVPTSQTRREQASQEALPRSVATLFSGVSPNVGTENLISNPEGEDVIVEVISGLITSGYNNNIEFTHNINKGENTSFIVTNHPNGFPVALDPGIRWGSGNVLSAGLSNNTSSTVSARVDIGYRFIR